MPPGNHGVKKLLFLGSSCIYPENGPAAPERRISADRIAGRIPMSPMRLQKLPVSNFAMPSARNTAAILFLPCRQICMGRTIIMILKNSHVLPALIRKFHEAKINKDPFVTIWGTGEPKREFLHVDDVADACVFLMENYNEAGLVNVGVGTDLSILELAELIARITGYTGHYSKRPQQDQMELPGN